MFQKLYKNLEEINSHGFEQSMELKRTREAIVKLTEQLALTVATVPMPVLPVPSESAIRTMAFQKAGLIILGVAIILLAIIAFSTIRSSGVNQKLLQAEIVQLDSSERSESSFSQVHNGQEMLKEKERVLELRISEMDSLLIAEHQSIDELKKLNNTAVRTFIRIRRAIEQRDQRLSLMK